MIGLIISFFFVYCFVLCLYYIVHFSNKDRTKVQHSSSSGRNRMRLEDAGKIYSNFINIPIIAESSKKKDSNKSQKELSKNTLICGTCFKSLPADSKFCIYCGSKIL